MVITMISHKLSCYASIIVVVVPFLARLAASDVLWQECDSSQNYTANSPFQSNLKQLSTTLPTEASSSATLFATAAVGAIPDTVYALTLCRGDTNNASACNVCVSNAFRDAQQVCAYNMDVAVYYDPCYLRFSNQNFPATNSNGNPIVLKNSQKVSSPVEVFDTAVRQLLNATGNYAAANSSRRFATGEEGFDSSNPTIYGLVQCTPDMSPADCRSCLGGIIALMPRYVSGMLGGRIIGVRCNFRYEVTPFFSGGPMLQLPAPAPPPVAANITPPTATGGRTGIKTGIVLAIALPIVAALLAIILIGLCIRRQRRRTERTRLPLHSTDTDDIESIDSLILDLSTLRAATDNFPESNRLGEGGFGAVYKK